MSAYLIHNKKISFRLSKPQSGTTVTNGGYFPSEQKNNQQTNKRNAEVIIEIRKGNVLEYNEGKTSQDWNVFSALHKLVETSSAKLEIKIGFENATKTSFISELSIKLEGEILNSIKATLGKEVRVRLEISGAKVKVGKCESMTSLNASPKDQVAAAASLRFGASNSAVAPGFTFGVGSVAPKTLTAARNFATLKSKTTALDPATINASCCYSAEMHLQQNKDMSIFCEDLMLFPIEWQKHWESAENADDVEFIAALNIIVKVLDYQNNFGGQPVPVYNSGSKDIFHLNKRLLQEKIGADVTITVSSGKEFKCHSAFLTAQSQVLKTLLEDDKAERKCLQLSEISDEAMMGLLSYLYYRDIDSALGNSNAAVELLQVANKYLVLDFENDIKTILLNKPCTWYDPDAVIKLFLFSRKSFAHNGLLVKSIQIMKLKPMFVMTCKEYIKMFRPDPEIGDIKKETNEKADHHIEKQLQIAKDLCSALLNSYTVTSEKDDKIAFKMLPPKE